MLGHPLQDNIAQSVLEVVNTVVGAREYREMLNVQGSLASEWWELLRGGVSIYELLPEVLRYPKDLFGAGVMEGIKERTAEERVRVFDVLAPTLVKESEKSQDRNAAFALALTAFACRPGFSQQAMLLREHAERVPEAILWLGALQVLSPLADTLLFESGVGWRIARELDRSGDVFSAPNAEACVAEVEKLSRVKSRGYRALVEKSRLDVEIYPMIVSTFRGVRDNAAVKDLREREYVESILAENQIVLENLKSLEVRLQEALHMVKEVRNANFGKKGGRERGRKR